uniref:NADH-ubiquinone oxidoreductase chain 4 n=1 Tax=Lyreidus brevifrons TaxID=1617980 RepID=A0A0D3QU39_LYRBR|nr:NADH dehydrogenase subunit 4 [Lyreidus brevifrons]AJR19297.1 NADH dehydrogenase subunit 4 [Lyreidus brevifrons]
MLKFILPLILLMKFKNEWGFIQLGLFMLGFLVNFMGGHNYTMYCLGFNLGMDYLSFILVSLSVWIISLVVLGSQKIYDNSNYSSSFLIVNILLLTALVITFSSMDYLLFYISFEASLIPTLILILGWGYQPERIQAGMYMLFYTLFLSLPLLGSLLTLYYLGGTLVIGLTELSSASAWIESIWYFSTVLAFMVKLPLYLFHLWLPKAHVEAPVAGSMVLAGVLLKLGGYGLIRVMMIFRSISLNFSWIWISVSLTGGIMISLVCLWLMDSESLMAYSSVAHMGLVLCGLIVLNWWGFTGAVVVMVGHGLCSSGLFYLANMVYERVSSRSLMVSKGLLGFMPSMGLWWFLLSISNMAAPPSLNLLGEISLIVGMISWSSITMVGIMLISFFSAAYTLYMYSLSQHGVFYSSIYSCCSGKVREYLVLTLHWIPLNMLILNSALVTM